MAQTSVLIVDEDLDRTAAAEAHLLKDHHLRVVGHARTTLVAREQVRLLHPDVVLLNRDPATVPGRLDGIGLTRHFKTHPHPLVVIVMSADESRAARDEAAAAGADALLLDLHLSTKLLPLIRRLHGEGPSSGMAPAGRPKRTKATAGAGR